MFYLQLDDMLALVKYEQTERHRRAQQDALADAAKQHRQARRGVAAGSWRWPVMLTSALLLAATALAVVLAATYGEPLPLG
jgi:hypothetical protein